MKLLPIRRKRGEHDGHKRGEGSLVHLRNEIDTVFDRFLEEPWSSWPASWSGGPQLTSYGLTPRVDLAESDDEVTVTAELPGIDPKDVETSVAGNLLMIRGEKTQEREEKKRNYRYIERSFGSLQRAIPLPNSVDASKIDAVHKNGVLTVTLKKQPGAKPRRIEVKTG
jgi:HSP20 family protein